MNKMNQIGLDEAKANALAESLNDLLANFQVFYMNVRGFHWNIRGEKFFELHLKFEELYNDLIIKVDEVAERVLTLGATPMHSFTDYIKQSDIKEVKDFSEGKACIESILDSFRVLLRKERKILELSSEANDEGTNAMASDYIREQEKLVWMYNAYLRK